MRANHELKIISCLSRPASQAIVKGFFDNFNTPYCKNESFEDIRIINKLSLFFRAESASEICRAYVLTPCYGLLTC